MERARELIRPYTTRPGVIGIYLVGSASRPFRDRLSDYDIEVAVDDVAYAHLTDGERHTFVVHEGPPQKVDHEFYLRPWSELESMVGSTWDLDHFPFQHAVVLHDPTGRLSELLGRLAHLPHEVRDARRRVHYLEGAWGMRRASKCLERDDPLNAHLVAGEAALAVAKLLFLQEGSWPSTRHWTRQELALLGVPADLVSLLEEALLTPEPSRVTPLLERVDRFLDEEGETFHKDRMGLFHWAVLTDAGKAAFRAWAAR